MKSLNLCGVALLVGSIAAICTDAAQARVGNASFSGSKVVSTRPQPTPPRVTEQRPTIKTNVKMMHCYHTRERNEMGVYVHRTHCG